MREILFRGKRFCDGEWVDGSLFIDEKKDKHEIIVGYFNYRIGWEVIPDTVGQFTGLTDKNGKKIFEGDIVVYDNKPYNAYCHIGVGVIVWHKWMWKFRYKEHEYTYHYSVGTEDFFGAKSEVIGNIHDNPELLEVE